MSNNIHINTNLTTAAPRPADAKIIVGPAQEYTGRESIPIAYRYDGMRVLDKTNNITYEWVVPSTLGLPGQEYYKNISFGVTPFIYRGNNNLWLNNGTNNMNVTQEEPILFDSITFGKINKITWTIKKNGVTIKVVNKESFQHSFISPGLHNIKVEVWDEYGNSTSIDNITITVTTIGMLVIEELNVLPYQGLTPTTTQKVLNFTAVISNLEIGALDYIKMYSGVGNFNNETTLYADSEWKNGVTYENGNLYIDGTTYTHLNGTFANTTQFKLKVQYYSPVNAEETVEYSAIPEIDIASAVGSYSYDSNTMTSTVVLNPTFDPNKSIVTGVLKDSFNTQVGTYTKTGEATFELSPYIVELAPGSYNYTASFTQRVNTGVGQEVHTVSQIIVIVVEEPTYDVTINVKDNHSPASNLQGVSVTLSETTGITNSSGNFIFEKANGYHALSYSKTNYIVDPSNVITGVTVNGTNVSINVTMEASIEIDTLSISPVAVDETGIVNYTLLPDNKYEDTSILTYTIGGVVTIQTLGDPDFGTFPFLSEHSGLDLTLKLETIYKSSSDMETKTVTVGEAPIYGNYVYSNMHNLYDSDFGDFFTIISLASLSDSGNIMPNLGSTTKPKLNPESLSTAPHPFGWFWAAFPKDVYPDFTEIRFGSLGSFNPLSDFLFASDVSINSLDYAFYIHKGGNTTTDVYFTPAAPIWSPNEIYFK